MKDLIINMILNLWYFKGSTFLLIFEIVPIAFNAFSIILSIILRMWRSDNSVLKKNFSSSRNVSYFLLVLIIINLLSTITEEVLYSFVYNQFHLEDEMENCWEDCEAKNNCSEDKCNKIEEKSKKLREILEKIINNPKKISYDFKDDKEVEKKYNILKLLPWIAFNFNIFIQLMMSIFDIILMGRIKIKSHFGFSKDDNNQSAKNKIIDGDINEKKGSKKKKKKKSKKANGIDIINIESIETNLQKKTKKKKKKRKKSTKKEHN